MLSSWKRHFIESVAAIHGRELMQYFVSRLRSASDARDLTQEVYLRLLRLERPDLIRSPEAYIFTIAANLAREHALKKAQHPLTVTLNEVPSQQLANETALWSDASLERDAEDRNRIARLEQVLNELSPKASAALVWHRRDGLSYEEIGVRLGVSRNMVKKYLSKSLAHCRKRLGEPTET